MNDWEEVTWIEAANAFAAGTHDVQRFAQQMWLDNQNTFSPAWRFRTREKQRTITVTIPVPCFSIAAFYAITKGKALILSFSTLEQRDAALEAIRAATEQQR